MRDIAAVPRRADDVRRLMFGRGLKPLRDRCGEKIAGEQGGTVAVINLRQHRVVSNERGNKNREYRGPQRADPGETYPIE